MVRQMAAVPRKRVQQRLFELLGANMAITTDQALTKLFTGTNFTITDIVVARATGGHSGACAGGFYNATSKPAGGILVAAAQIYTNLTAVAGKVQIPTLAALNGTDIQSAATIYLSLTTANGAALTTNIYVYGYIID